MRREFPKCPLVGVAGVVIHRGRVLLIRRKRPPLKGEWSIPGGLVELGEELDRALRRELKEETGLEVEPLELLTVIDRIMPGGRGGTRVRYHFVIVDYICRLLSGRLSPASDVLDARWVRPKDLPKYHLAEKATEVIQQALARYEALSAQPSGVEHQLASIPNSAS
ncbi:MAG: NUDIX hydrolase [Terriglobia bacterium]|jgi:ADP-ribose pyrophosphatase YjhB (NUDIX family)